MEIGVAEIQVPAVAGASEEPDSLVNDFATEDGRGIFFAARRFEGAAGSINLAEAILEGLLSGGFPVTVLSEDAAASCPATVAVGAKWCQVSRSRSGMRWKFGRRIVARFPGRVKRDAVGILEVCPGDALVVNGFGSDFVWNYTTREKLSSATLIVHDSPDRYSLAEQPSMEWAVEQMGRFTHFVFPSAVVREQWRQTGCLDRRESLVIPNCCREGRLEEVMRLGRQHLRQRYGIDDRTFVLMCVGNLHHHKGQDLLLDALPALSRIEPRLEMWFVGPPGDVVGRKWGDRFIKRAGAASAAVRILGRRTDSLGLIAAADALILPSRSEVMPVTVLEAMALKTPVLATGVGGIPELIQDRRSGVLFLPNDREAVIEAFEFLMALPDRGRQLAEEGHARYWRLFSRRQLIARYGEAARRLVRGEHWNQVGIEGPA